MSERTRWFDVSASRRVVVRWCVMLSAITGLAGCAPEDGAVGGYPLLRSVPAEPRASTPIDQRRDIVRDLIDQRDRSRLQTTEVRTRSGLDAGGFAELADTGLEAEEVVPDAPEPDGEGFRLTPADDGEVDSIYRSEPEFEDGGLDDFIRRLRRDTSPSAPLDPTPGEPGADDLIPDEDAADRQVDPDGEGEDEIGLHLPISRDAPMMLAAIAPVVADPPMIGRDVAIRLAAAEGEPGFFCRFFGWTVAWSSMCVVEAGPLPEADDDVAADLEQEIQRSEDDASSDSGRSARSRSSAPEATGEEAGRERAERRLSEEDAAEAIENAGRSALAPVTSSLEKLRDFIENRRSGGDVSPRDDRTAALRQDPLPPDRRVDRPPVPRDRPERRLNVSIEDGGERFDFVRTPRPHFKPSRDDGPVILPPENPGRERAPLAVSSLPPPTPHERPDDLVPERDLVTEAELRAAEARLNAAIATLKEGVSTIEPPQRPAEGTPASARLDAEAQTAGPVPTEPALPDVVPPVAASPDGAPAATPNAEPAEPIEPVAPPSPTIAAIEPETLDPAAAPPSSERQPLIVMFEPATPGLPQAAIPALAALLEDAKVNDLTIHIIGEASTNHLARRRATDVGAALVQLGATVEILEYDHQALTGADQVRLVLRPETEEPLFSTTVPSTIEK